MCVRRILRKRCLCVCLGDLLETVVNMSSGLHSVWRIEGKVHGVLVAYLFEKIKCVERGGGCHVRDGICKFLGQMSQGTERAEAAARSKPLLAMVLDRLLSGERPTSLVDCVRKNFCKHGMLVFDGNQRMVFLRTDFRSEGAIPAQITLKRSWMHSEPGHFKYLYCLIRFLAGQESGA